MVSIKEMGRLDAERQPPAWFHSLLATKFFEPCPKHPATTGGRWTRTTGCNFFCADCSGDALCSGSCLADHAGHRLIQVRRSSCHNVVKVADLERLQLNVRFVQTYVYNNEAAVFLNKRGVSGKEKPGQIRCEGCNWGLMDSECRFCSLRCKAEDIKDNVDFSVSFAVNHNHNSSGEEPEESEDEEHQVSEGRNLISGSMQVAV